MYSRVAHPLDCNGNPEPIELRTTATIEVKLVMVK